MTTQSAPTARPDSSWADELAAHVSPRCFPATHDRLAARLIERHAPSHLLWHLALASRTREYGSLEELVQHLAVAPQRGPLASLEPLS